MPTERELVLPTGPGFAAIAALLRDHHRITPPRPSQSLLDELVATILSQHTSDQNSQRAFRELKRAFPDWSSALAAGAGPIADAIRGGGLANQKAPRIVELLASVPLDERGEPSLDHLAETTPDRAYAELQHYKGVGPKTAACALLFAYGWALFPVDTHVHRVSIRLGWARPGEPAEKVQARLMEAVPSDVVYDLHMGMVRHGRLTCKARSPDCGTCVLAELCPAGMGIAGAAETGNELPAQVFEGS